MTTPFAPIALSAALAGLTLAGGVQAAPAFTTLGGCFNTVIGWCNRNSDDRTACAAAATEACEAHFGAPAAPAFDRISVRLGTPDRPGYRFVFEATAAHPLPQSLPTEHGTESEEGRLTN
ncbi:MAG: hypothetical protein AAFU80_17835 [Pseudomonadota bacterium]